MSSPLSGILGSLLDDASSKQLAGFTSKSQKKNKKKQPKSQLELAFAVMLVELASYDQKFEVKEYNAIVTGMMRLFGTQRTEVTKLVNQATVTLANLRGTQSFVQLLRDNLDEDEKKAVMEVLEEVINADGVVDDYEVYLRNKFSQILGIVT